MATVIKSPELIYDKMRQENAPYFIVKEIGNSKSYIDVQESDIDVERAIKQLEDTLAHLDGTVTINVSKKSAKALSQGGDTRVFSYTLKLGTAISGPSAPGINNSNSLFEMLIAQMNQNFQLQLQLMNEKFDYQRKIDKLVESDPEDDYKKLMLKEGIKRFDRLFPMNESQPINQPQLAGVPETKEQPKLQKIEMSEEKTKQLNLAIHQLLEADKDFIEHIQMLAKLAKSDPEIYQMAIKKLKAFS